MPDVQKKAIIELSKDILKRHPQLKIVGHRDLNATSCPGKYFPMDEIVDGVNGNDDAIATEPKKLYRIRKSWNDAKSQLGAYVNLSGAKAECPEGYSVYDWNGKVVYTKEKKVVTVKRNFVKESQEYLNKKYKAGLTVDGIWGPKTNTAVIKVLQRAIGADVDGIWGPETYSKCGVYGVGDTGLAVIALQLLSAKFDGNLEVDGDFGSKTEAFVIKMQKRYGLSVDGLAGKNTFKTLFDV